MLFDGWMLFAAAIVVAILLVRAFGRTRGGIASIVLLAAVGAWLVFAKSTSQVVPVDESPPLAALTSADCAKCHARHHGSWHSSYHRTMTRDATPEYVKGDFSNKVHSHDDVPTRLTREGDSFFMETVHPDWAALRARAGNRTESLPPQRSVKLRVDRLVGSHWLQECLHQAPNGQFVRLPVLYHLGERRWVHSNGAFLTPDSNDFWAQSRGTTWNESCLYCHNTEPSKNPVRGPRGETTGFDTTVSELGISCAACHGPGTEHVRQHQNPTTVPDPGHDIVNPRSLSVARRDQICARCHGALVPKSEMWDPRTHKDPFVPGEDLTRFNSLFWSEEEQALLSGQRRPTNKPAVSQPIDGRFWGDGTPLTTALEYNGMALSACYEKGAGKLSCLSCHTMHGDDPNFQLKPSMGTNEACYTCHADYRGRLAEHTRHAPASTGSLCYNCHMPHQVYSLMTTHRSHRIQVPDLASSVGTGKPHACNLCHLDKSLGWTRDQLALWPNKKKMQPHKLSVEEEGVSSAVLTLARSDARSRVVVAGAFSNPGAQAASGTEWFGPILTRLLPHERYPAVRYLAHRGLKAAHKEAFAGQFDFQANPTQRDVQLRALREHFDSQPIRRPLPYLPLTREGRVDEAALDRLRAGRLDPDVSIHE